MGQEALTRVRQQMYIDGQWVEARSGETKEILDPATEEVIARVPRAGAEDVEQAITAARRAFDEGEWPSTSARERSRLLYRIAEALEKDKATLATLESLNTGKTLVESETDVDDVAACFRYFAGLVATEGGGVNESRPGTLSLTLREPVGVCALITPWNYPLLQAAWKIAPALGAGNTCIVKPAEITPLTTLRFAQLVEELGVPAGVFNVVTGPGSTVGELLSASPRVDMVSFTGGAEAGRRVMELAAANFKRVAFELGGKNANIIFADADLDVALDYALNAAFFHAGQVCSAGARILVEDDIYETFLERLVEKVGRIRLGNGFDEGTEMGPVISAAQREKVEYYIRLGQEEGARLACGGKRPSGPAFQKGFWLEPTVLADVQPHMRVAQEEIFGPVVTVEPFASEEEVIRTVNSLPTGLAGGVWSGDLGRGIEVARRIRVGTIWVNDYNPYFPEAPWGGYKMSGIGRELWKVGLDEYTEFKHLFANLKPAPLGWFKG